MARRKMDDTQSLVCSSDRQNIAAMLNPASVLGCPKSARGAMFNGCRKNAGQCRGRRVGSRMMKDDPLSSKECAERLRALADQDRLRIVQVLRGGERNVGDLAAELRRQATLARHL